MIGFLEDIMNMTGLPLDIIGGGFRLINFNNKALFISGYVSLLSVTDSQIKLKLKRGVLDVVGKELKLKDMQSDCVMIVGDILESHML